MARGFESKSVESQQSEGIQRVSRTEDRDFAERRERDNRRAGLETSRRRIERELEQTSSDTHRSALKNALEFLDSELRKLD